MFKEAFVTIILFTILTIILALLLQKKKRIAKHIIVIFFAFCLTLNTIYNFRTLFPNFVLDSKTPLGDCEKNLFLYKSDSEFPCEILFPILQDRTVLIDDSFPFYDKFFQTFAKHTESIHVTDEEYATVFAAAQNFSFQATMSLIEMMDYVFPENDYYDLWYGPKIFLETRDLSTEDTLVAVVDEYWYLYIMSERHYYEILNSATQGDEN